MEIDGIIDQMLASGGFWLPVALVLSMVVVNIAKMGCKTFLKNKGFKYYPILFRVVAYAAGFSCGVFFLEGADAIKWAVVLGLVNPVVYHFLENYAVENDKKVLLSVLKGHRIHTDKDGNTTVEDTQQFMARQEQEQDDK